jgi:hypothetical protein
MALESTQPLKEMRISNLPGLKGGQRAKVKPYRRLWAYCLDNVAASTSHNLVGLQGLSKR